jgi:hypothetical protein
MGLEVGGVIARHTKMLKGAKKQVKRSLPQDTVYEVGAKVQVDWPLNDGSTSKCRAVIAERECRLPKSFGQGEFWPGWVLASGTLLSMEAYECSVQCGSLQWSRALRRLSVIALQLAVHLVQLYMCGMLL